MYHVGKLMGYFVIVVELGQFMVFEILLEIIVIKWD